MRIQWRITDPGGGGRASRGRQSLALIDAIAPHVRLPDIALYRLEASVLAGQPPAAVTTAKMIASALGPATHRGHDDDAVGGFGPEGQAALEAFLQRCDAVLTPLQNNKRIDQRRLQGVRRLVRQRLQQLQPSADQE